MIKGNILWAIVFLGVLLMGGIFSAIRKTDDYWDNSLIIAFIIGIVWCIGHC